MMRDRPPRSPPRRYCIFHSVGFLVQSETHTQLFAAQVCLFSKITSHVRQTESSTHTSPDSIPPQTSLHHTRAQLFNSDVFMHRHNERLRWRGVSESLVKQREHCRTLLEEHREALSETQEHLVKLHAAHTEKSEELEEKHSELVTKVTQLEDLKKAVEVLSENPSDAEEEHGQDQHEATAADEEHHEDGGEAEGEGAHAEAAATGHAAGHGGGARGGHGRRGGRRGGAGRRGGGHGGHGGAGGAGGAPGHEDDAGAAETTDGNSDADVNLDTSLTATDAPAE